MLLHAILERITHSSKIIAVILNFISLNWVKMRRKIFSIKAVNDLLLNKLELRVSESEALSIVCYLENIRIFIWFLHISHRRKRDFIYYVFIWQFRYSRRCTWYFTFCLLYVVWACFVVSWFKITSRRSLRTHKSTFLFAFLDNSVLFQHDQMILRKRKLNNSNSIECHKKQKLEDKLDNSLKKKLTTSLLCDCDKSNEKWLKNVEDVIVQNDHKKNLILMRKVYYEN